MLRGSVLVPLARCRDRSTSRGAVAERRRQDDFLQVRDSDRPSGSAMPSCRLRFQSGAMSELPTVLVDRLPQDGELHRVERIDAAPAPVGALLHPFAVALLAAAAPAASTG